MCCTVASSNVARCELGMASRTSREPSKVSGTTALVGSEEGQEQLQMKE